MAKKSADGASRSEFIRKQLHANANVSCKEVIAAWEKLGHSDPIKPTLFYLVKSKSGFSKGGKGRRGRPRGSTAAAATAAKGDSSGLLEIEQSLDRLIARAADLKDNRLAEDLRVARRRVSAKLV